MFSSDAFINSFVKLGTKFSSLSSIMRDNLRGRRLFILKARICKLMDGLPEFSSGLGLQ